MFAKKCDSYGLCCVSLVVPLFLGAATSWRCLWYSIISSGSSFELNAGFIIGDIFFIVFFFPVDLDCWRISIECQKSFGHLFFIHLFALYPFLAGLGFVGDLLASRGGGVVVVTC